MNVWSTRERSGRKTIWESTGCSVNEITRKWGQGKHPLPRMHFILESLFPNFWEAKFYFYAQFSRWMVSNSPQISKNLTILKFELYLIRK